MKKKFQLPILLALLIAFGNTLTSCQGAEEIDMVNPADRLQAMIHRDGNYMVDEDTCRRLNTYGISYQILDTSESAGHDIALRILAGFPINMGDCLCDTLKYCVTLSFPIDEVESVGFQNECEPFEPLSVERNDHGGYVDCLDPREPEGSYYQSHKICAIQNSNRLVFFDLLTGFPSGYDLSDAIIEVKGICIVGNLDDTIDPPNGNEIDDDDVSGGNDD